MARKRNTELTSRRAAPATSKVLRNPRSTRVAKILGVSALVQSSALPVFGLEAESLSPTSDYSLVSCRCLQSIIRLARFSKHPDGSIGGNILEYG